jgi:hypothetical protein
MNIFGEIASLSEFNEDHLYLFYEFSLPLGYKVDDENEYYLIYKAENIEEENINKLKSISQISEAYVERYPVESEIKTNLKNYEDNSSSFDKFKRYFMAGPKNVEQHLNKHNLSLPFELELLCHNLIIDKSTPKLLIQINSTDSYNRHRIEGYCFLNIPTNSGYFQFEVPCYKPKEDNYMKVFSFFLGGSRKIPDLKEIAKTCTKDEKNVDTVLNRYGISTEYVGKVTINLNVVMQTKEFQEISRSKVKDKQGREAYIFSSAIEGLENQQLEETSSEMFTTGNLMRTKNHGIINRFSN